MNVRSQKWRLLVAVAVGAALLVVGGVAYATISSSAVLNACAQKNNGQLRLVSSASDCRPSEYAVAWNQEGPQGPQGLPGQDGEDGEDGQAGQDATSLWAYVSGDGVLIRGSHAVSSARLVSQWGIGSYEVIFDQNVSGCSYQVTPGEDAGDFGDPSGGITFNAGEANVYLRTGGPGANNGVFVQLLNSAGTAQHQNEFHVAIFC
jgi:hypothetical protein